MNASCKWNISYIAHERNYRKKIFQRRNHVRLHVARRDLSRDLSLICRECIAAYITLHKKIKRGVLLLVWVKENGMYMCVPNQGCIRELYNEIVPPGYSLCQPTTCTREHLCQDTARKIIRLVAPINIKCDDVINRGVRASREQCHQKAVWRW